MKKKELKDKIDKLNIALKNRSERIKNQSSELNKLLVQNEEIQRKLNIANNTVCEQIEAIDKLTNMYERQLSVQDKELDRRLVIINYLEEKCLNVYND